MAPSTPVPLATAIALTEGAVSGAAEAMTEGALAVPESLAAEGNTSARPMSTAHVTHELPPTAPSTADVATPESVHTTPPAVRAHDTDRAAEILKQIRLRMTPETREATIHLSPPELGRISIHLVLAEHRLTASVRGEKRETIEALGRHLPELRAALASHGIEAEQFDLALGFQNDDRGRSKGGDAHTSGRAPASAWNDRRPEHDEPLSRALASTSGVDTYA